MKKEELLRRYSIVESQVKEWFAPQVTKSLSLPKDFKYGIEIEFPYDVKEGIDLQGNFEHYNKTELDMNWSFNKEFNLEYPPNVVIGEFVSPILSDNIQSLDQLNLILQLVRAFQHPRLKAKERNIHFHLDMNLLGKSLEYLRPFLEIFRAYENIIFRIATSETGKVRKDGISDRIANSLKQKSNRGLLKTFNGGDYNLQTLKKYRRLPINLFNIGAYQERPNKNAKPGVIFEKEGEFFKRIESGRFVLDTIPYRGSTKYEIQKTLTPTMELRLTPSTDSLGFVQQHLLLYGTLIYIARELDKTPE